MFQIVRVAPAYHYSTDAIIGSTSHPLPMSYKSAALAHKLAGRLTDVEYDGCGDDYFAVVAYGESVFSDKRHYAAVDDAAFDDMGF